jgi:hypothetical protein
MHTLLAHNLGRFAVGEYPCAVFIARPSRPAPILEVKIVDLADLIGNGLVVYRRVVTSISGSSGHRGGGGDGRHHIAISPLPRLR